MVLKWHWELPTLTIDLSTKIMDLWIYLNLMFIWEKKGDHIEGLHHLYIYAYQYVYIHTGMRKDSETKENSIYIYIYTIYIIVYTRCLWMPKFHLLTYSCIYIYSYMLGNCLWRYLSKHVPSSMDPEICVSPLSDGLIDAGPGSPSNWRGIYIYVIICLWDSLIHLAA